MSDPHPMIHDPLAVDPELLALPAVPSARRAAVFVVMAFTATCALVLATLLWADVRYAFRSATPVAEADVLRPEAAGLPLGETVVLRGAPMASNAIVYRRALGGQAYVAFSLAGQRDVWVQVPVRGSRDEVLARRSFTGRLVEAHTLGVRFDAVRRYASRALGQPIDAHARVLLADEAPSDAWPAVLQVLFALLVVATDAWLILRWFKPLPAEPEAADQAGTNVRA